MRLPKNYDCHALMQRRIIRFVGAAALGRKIGLLDQPDDLQLLGGGHQTLELHHRADLPWDEFQIAIAQVFRFGVCA